MKINKITNYKQKITPDIKRIEKAYKLHSVIFKEAFFNGKHFWYTKEGFLLILIVICIYDMASNETLEHNSGFMFYAGFMFYSTDQENERYSPPSVVVAVVVVSV